MSVIRHCVLAFALVAVGSPAQDSKPRDAAATPAPAAITIGVVDLDKAIENYGRAIAEKERLAKLSADFTQKIDAMTKDIDELRAAMALHKPGTVEHDQEQLRLQTAIAVREGQAKIWGKQFDDEIAAYELAIFEDLGFAIARVAEDRGVAIVLRAQPVLELDPRDRLVQHKRRAVLYQSPEVDLTPFVVKYLKVFDPRAEREKAAAAAAPATPGAAGGEKAGDKSGDKGNSNPQK
ncbi:MAG: OmpH family outer membrane protein [Planctomycetes bacterium]|nr:OmpH family outer membrane protein [Planctomycetota bacterium]